ncbi:hypothetical protein ZWY2020_009948 [Hordeum vulgare]|nr:hypothetical protein ZWY2020_009948 [Hordeum vulgare]
MAPYTRAGQGRCTFDVKFQYGDSRARGVLGSDDFVFDGSGPGSPISSVNGLVFGCAHNTHDFYNHDLWAGVASLNRHRPPSSGSSRPAASARASPIASPTGSTVTAVASFDLELTSRTSRMHGARRCCGDLAQEEACTTSASSALAWAAEGSQRSRR